MSAPTFTPPDRFDEFRLTRPLGEGAMGQIFLCEDTTLFRQVAVKFLKGVELNPGLRSRFLTEARAIARLAHPNVVTIYRVGEVSGVPYLASEFISGQSLDKLPLPLPPPQVMAIALGLARGLAAAHQRGVLHRDIKPANIMLTSAQDVKLLDFGLAKVLDTLPGNNLPAVPAPTTPRPTRATPLALDETLPSEEEVPAVEKNFVPDTTPQSHQSMAEGGAASDPCVGTPLYMAPEVWSSFQATPRTDIYSLGAVLYELACGRPPHPATDYFSLRTAATTAEVTPLTKLVPELPTDFAALVDRCLRRDPQERFASGEELLVALETLPSRNTEGQPVIKPRLSVRQVRYLGAGLVATIIAAVLILWRALQPVGGMVDFSGAAFTMGATADEILAVQDWCKKLLGNECDSVVLDAFQREQPQRRVTLSAFSLDRREVTTQEFVDWLNVQADLDVEKDRYVKQRGVLLADAYPMYDPFGGFTYDRTHQRFVVPPKFRRRPVTQVSWYAAQRFCMSHGKRLPTEAEWEFAARGTEGRRFPWGYEEPTCNGTIYSRRVGMQCASAGTGPTDVATAAQDRTPEGVFDLGGSVAEWVTDAFRENYPSCPEPCHDPLVAPASDVVTERRVVRGGAWQWPVYLTRGTTRSRYEANAAPISFGFRCAISR